MKHRILGLLGWGAAIVLIEGFSVQAPEAKADLIREEYCIRSIGDFDHDGIDDHAASQKHPIRRLPLTAYILPGAKIDPANVDPAELPTHEDVIVLRGPKAAPFMCTPGPKRPVVRPFRAAALVAPVLRAASPVGQPTRYRFIDMDAMSPRGYTIPEAINAKGHVAGTFWVTWAEDRAFIYDGSAMQDLGTLGGDFSQALDLNTWDDVVGFSGTGEIDDYGFVMNACIYDGFPMESLGLGDSWANGINDRNQIVGGLRDASKTVRGYLYSAGQAIDIGSLGGSSSEAHAVDPTGAVVGTSRIAAPQGSDWHHAFVYRKGVMRDLGTLGRMCWISDDEGHESCFEESIATDINKNGRIVGFSSTGQSSAHAFLFAQGRMRDLGTLGGHQSWANAINNAGQIVGTSLNADENYTPFLYQQGVMSDLNDLIAEPAELPFLPAVAEDINDFGQIVGAHYMLQPLYESVRPGSVYAFGETLGSRFSLEFWVAPVASSSGRDGVRLQIKFEVPETADSRFVNRWLPFGPGVGKTQWGTVWQKATIALPRNVRGKNATINLRARYFNAEPEVYMRHFRFQ